MENLTKDVFVSLTGKKIGDHVFQIVRDMYANSEESVLGFCGRFTEPDTSIYDLIVDDVELALQSAADECSKRDAEISKLNGCLAVAGNRLDELDELRLQLLEAKEELEKAKAERDDFKYRYDRAVKSSGEAQEKFNKREDTWAAERQQLKEDKVALFMAYRRELRRAEALQDQMQGYSGWTKDAIEALLEAERA